MGLGEEEKRGTFNISCGGGSLGLLLVHYIFSLSFGTLGDSFAIFFVVVVVVVVVVGFARYHLIYSSSTMIFLGTWITLR